MAFSMDLRHQDKTRPRPLRADRLALRVGSLRHEDPGSFDQGAAPVPEKRGAALRSARWTLETCFFFRRKPWVFHHFYQETTEV